MGGDRADGVFRGERTSPPPGTRLCGEVGLANGVHVRSTLFGQSTGSGTGPAPRIRGTVRARSARRVDPGPGLGVGEGEDRMTSATMFRHDALLYAGIEDSSSTPRATFGPAWPPTRRSASR